MNAHAARRTRLVRLIFIKHMRRGTVRCPRIPSPHRASVSGHIEFRYRIAFLR